MRFNSLSTQSLIVATFALTACQSATQSATPSFSDGGYLRNARRLTTAALGQFDGMYNLSTGQDLFGDDVAVRASKNTLAILSGKDASYANMQVGCMSDGRLVAEGYWRYPRETAVGLVRLFVGPEQVATALCSGETLAPDTAITLSGHSGEDNELPKHALSLTYATALKPWKGKFFSIAHHGACEVTDSCGASPNSLETIRLSEQIGANGMEVDIRVTKDGVPILFHDPTMSGSYVQGVFCRGAVEDLTLLEIKANCRLQHGEIVPTVEEALEVMVNETELEVTYLDIKVPEAVEPVYKLAQKYNAIALDKGRNFVSVVALTKDEVTEAWNSTKAKYMDVPPPCLVEYDASLVGELGCVAWGPTWTSGPQVDNVSLVRSFGARVIYWTMNDEAFISSFLQVATPDGFITSRTSLVFYLYQKIGTVPPTATVRASGVTP